MKRTVEIEWLDRLPANDPGALGSRRDLHRLNGLMGHVGTLARILESSAIHQTPVRMVELGAGDGLFSLRLAHRLARVWPKVELILVDCKPAITPETRERFAALNWKMQSATTDVFAWLQSAEQPADVMFANLFLHQFDTPQLTRMLTLAAVRTKLFAACEPRRSKLPFAMSRLLGLIGCNAVTRNDAPLSVRAGFVGHELSALWPATSEWQLRENRAGLFSHAFVAKNLNRSEQR